MAERLQARGLFVHARLRARVLVELSRAAISADCAPAPDGSDALTWINLA
jgi:hypothetical protein